MYPSYYWLTTIHWTGDDGINRTTTGSGLMTPQEGDTRQTMTEHITQQVRKEADLDDTVPVAVLYMSIEPNLM